MSNPAIQERLRTYLEEERGKGSEGVTQEALGKQLGYSSGAVLSAYLKDNYKGRIEPLEERLSNFFGFREKDTEFHAQGQELRPLERTAYVQTSYAKRIYSIIDYCRLRGGIAVIHGAAGVGKSLTAYQYQQSNQGFVVRFRAKDGCRCTNEVMDEVARRLGVSGSVSRKDRYAEVRRCIDGARKVIIVDEAQRLPKSSLEVLRELTDPNEDTLRDGAALVLMGNTYVQRFVEKLKSADMEQFKNRQVHTERLETGTTKPEDIQLLFPYLTQSGMEKELNLLWAISKSSSAIRGAVNTYNGAALSQDVSYKGLLQSARAIGIKIV